MQEIGTGDMMQNPLDRPTVKTLGRNRVKLGWVGVFVEKGTRKWHRGSIRSINVSCRRIERLVTDETCVTDRDGCMMPAVSVPTRTVVVEQAAWVSVQWSWVYGG